MKKVLSASHLQLARSLNLWHVLAGTVNKLKLPLQANPALYVPSQLWTCHLFLLYGIFKSIEKVFHPVFFFLSIPYFLDVSPSSDHSSLFWLWKKGRKGRGRHSHGVLLCQTHGMGEEVEEGPSTGWRCWLWDRVLVAGAGPSSQ